MRCTLSVPRVLRIYNDPASSSRLHHANHGRAALCAFVSLDTSSAQIIDASEKQETPISLDGSLHGFVISCVF